jgi:small ligand-binding sensory domain FIST
MGVRIGTGLSTHHDPRAGAIEAAATARAALGGRSCDLAVLFAAGAHLAAPEATLEGLHDALEPEVLVGCGAGGVIGETREVEGGTAVSVWAAALDGGSVMPFHATVEPIGDGEGVLSGLPELTGAAGAVMLADPFSFPADPVLRQLSASSPMVPLLGGLASGRSPEDETPLFLGDDVHTEGAVGLRFDGVDILPCVSHGAAPVGPELTITAAEGTVIGELAGRPALEKLRETLESLPLKDRRMVKGALLMGIVIDANKPEYVQGDFLVRGLVGADPETGEIAVGTVVRPGQVVRLHARDAESADRDLREALEARMAALGGRVPAGALLFSCNGRGRDMFGHDHHDASALEHVLGGAPAAGFFAAGEIGPVGGQYFLHAYTATVAVFAP